MRFIVSDGHISALLQAGRIQEARDIAERLHQQAADLPGAAQLFSAGQVGMAALAAGHLGTACDLLEWVVEALCASGDTTGRAYRYQLPRTVALSMRGPADAAAAFAALKQQRHPTWRYLDYEYALAEAWVAAAAGATSDAISTVLSEAENARAGGQFAGELICLQTATQFGDRSCASRLAELTVIVEGPRVGLAARFASAAHRYDGAELAAVSDAYERMGDLVAPPTLPPTAHRHIGKMDFVDRRTSAELEQDRWHNNAAA